MLFNVNILLSHESIGICLHDANILIKTPYETHETINNSSKFVYSECLYTKYHDKPFSSLISIPYDILLIGEGINSTTRSLLNISYDTQNHLKAPYFDKTIPKISQITSILKFPPNSEGIYLFILYLSQKITHNSLFRRMSISKTKS